MFLPIIIGNFVGIDNSLGDLTRPGCTGGIACALEILGSVISITLGVITICAGLYFVFQVFSGAFLWLTSGGDKQSLESAKKKLTHALIGLLMVVLSYATISVIGLVFGLDILSVRQILNFRLTN